ncbi:MAG: UDP-N-acetylmuramoyl-L-alanine--D-glutamate ligase [Alphaproteobacteria bacterium]|nr:UDP-N-acetylmuramoyl-L-alanine--D-glutamate ligase [Alphaproteobacteria bacterium]
MRAISLFRGKRVAVFGLARSGLSAARALAAGGAEVAAWDDKAESRAQAAAAGIALAPFAGAGTAALVLSPGVPLTHPRPHAVVRAANDAGVEILGDVELFARAGTQARIVGVTGTNGKSTTTALIGHILAEAKLPVAVGGNLGTPVLDLPELGADGVYVLELSSYQLDLTGSLACSVAVLLNVTPDHLDRHGDMAGYVKAKRRLFDMQRPGAVAVIGIDDAHGAETAKRLEGRARVLRVSVGSEVAAGAYVLDGVLYEAPGGQVCDLRQAAPRLPGAHNWQNAAAAFVAVRALGLSVADATRGLGSFPGLAHRLELIATVGGVVWINDSKATNADAAEKALAAYERIHWIAGGLAKEGGIEGLRPLFGRLRHAYLIGEAAEAFARTLGKSVPQTRAGTLARAVEAARANAKPGEVVLLSPACASFDQFANFEARGDAFRALVREFAS